MQTVTVSGDLFRIALKYLGDATQATRIATLNGLPDYFLAAPTTIALPKTDPAQTGGAPTL